MATLPDEENIALAFWLGVACAAVGIGAFYGAGFGFLFLGIALMLGALRDQLEIKRQQKKKDQS